MKSISRIISVLLATVTLAHSQDEFSGISSESAATPTTLTTARILREIPDGTPPPPAPPKPEYHVAAQDILSTATHQQGGRTITIREIKPIALPPPPPPAEITGDTKPTAEEMAVIQSLHDIYNGELERLKTAYEGRERARIEREEYLKANQPPPKDIILNFWRTETPAANSKGGAK